MRRLREHPSAAARSSFPNGEGCDTRILLFSTQRLSQGERHRGGGFAAKKGSQPRLATLGSPFQGKGLAWSLPPSFGRRCPKGAEVGYGKRYERERGRSSQVRRLRKHPIHRCAVPLPQWGRLRYGDTVFLDTTTFPRGKAKSAAASPPKKEANPASLRSAAPSKGRGSRGHSLLPMEGGAPKGRRLDGKSGMKESEGDRLKCAIIREHPIHR